MQTMSNIEKLFIPKDVGELMFGNVSSEEKDPYWHLFDPTGDGEHTFCSMAWDEIEELNKQFGVKTKSKRGGFCDCPYCINTIMTLKTKLDKIKIKEV